MFNYIDFCLVPEDSDLLDSYQYDMYTDSFLVVYDNAPVSLFSFTVNEFFGDEESTILFSEQNDYGTNVEITIRFIDEATILQNINWLKVED